MAGAKSFVMVALLVSVCCASARSLENTRDRFFVEGKIYCDPCHLEFETRLSYPLSDVKVSLECRNIANNTVTVTTDGKTDENGIYSLPVTGDHEEDICELRTVESTHPDCNLQMSSSSSDRIELTRNMGVSSMARYVNPLGFMTVNYVDQECGQVISELQLETSSSSHYHY